MSRIGELAAMRGAVTLPRFQAMCRDRGKYRLHVFGQHRASRH